MLPARFLAVFAATSSTHVKAKHSQQIAKHTNNNEQNNKASLRVYTGNDFQSLSVAAGIFLAWAYITWLGLTVAHWGITPWYQVGFLAVVMEYLYVGLFITAHDAMHGVVCRRNRKLNNAIGRAAATLYAWFDYDMLHEKHWEHHRHAGQVGKDPDFHTGKPGLWTWYNHFMTSYMTWKQLAILGVQSWLLMFVFPVPNVLLYTAACPIATAFHLWYFGTYLPHKPDWSVSADGNWPETHSRTTDAPWWITTLQCYNFGLHLEHHMWPAVPWYLLPQARTVRKALAAQQGEKALKVYYY